MRSVFRRAFAVALSGLLFVLAAGVPNRASAETLVAGIPRGFPPHYVVDEDGTVRGFAIDYLSEIARRAGLTIEYKVFPSWDDVTRALDDGRIDLIPNMGITKARAGLGRFTLAYESFAIGMYVSSRRHVPLRPVDLKNRVVGTVSTNRAVRILTNLGVKPEVFPDVETALVMLADGKIEVLVYPEPPVEQTAERLGLAGRIYHVGAPLAFVDRGILLGRRRADLLQTFNRHIRDFNESPAYDELYRRWFAPAERAPAIEWVRLVAIGLAATVVCFLLLAGLSYAAANRGGEVTAESELKHRLWRRMVIVAAVLSAMSSAAVAFSTIYLYLTAFDSETQAVEETADAASHLLGAIARFGQKSGTGGESPRQATLKQALEGFSNLRGASEVEIAERQDDHLVFLFRGKAAQRFSPRRITLDSRLAEPMRRALDGESGTQVGYDYRGVKVLAAYRAIPDLNIALVIKRDLSELRAPFITAGWVVAASAVLISLLGSLLYFRLSAPIVASVLDRESRFRGLFATMGNGVLICHPADAEGQDFVVHDANPAAERIEGRPRDEIVGHVLGECLPDVHRTGCLAAVREVWRTGEARDLSARLYEDARVSQWRACRIYKLRTGEIVLDYDDVTARVRDREALRQSEERFELAMRGANDGLWDWNATTDEVYFSPRWKSMLGFADHEIGVSFDEWQKRVHPEDLTSATERVRDYMDRKTSVLRQEFRMRHKDGHWVHVLARGHGVWDGDGNCVRVIGTHTDLTDLREAEASLRREKERFEAYLDLAGNLFVVLDQTGTVLLANRAVCEVLGYDAHELDGQDWFTAAVPAEDRDMRRLVLERILGRDPGVEHVELPVVTRTGARRLIRWHNTALVDARTGETNVLASGEDVTEIRQAEAALLAEGNARAELARIVNESPAVAFSWSAAKGWPVTFVSENVRQFGYTPQDFTEGRIDYAHFIHPEDRGDVTAAVFRSLRESRQHLDLLYRVVTRAGEVRWVDTRVFDTGGDGSRASGVVLDVTDRMDAENRARQYLQTAGTMFVTLDRDGLVRSVNDKTCEVLGVTPAMVVGRDWVATYVAPDQQDSVRTLFDNITSRRTDAKGEQEFDVMTARGERRTVLWTYSAFESADGGVGDLIAFGVDVTRQRDAERRVREYASLPHENPNPVMRLNAKGNIVLVNEAAKGFLHELTKATSSDQAPGTHTDWDDLVKTALASRGVQQFEFQCGERTVLFNIVHARGGEYINLYGVDVTDSKAAERRLNMAAKMEALGHLTGGVAHDFNNLLTVILGNLDLFKRDHVKDEIEMQRIERIADAARSAAELTRRLLSFSRQQILERRTVDVNELIHGMVPLLRRTLGDDIELVTGLTKEDCIAWTDRNRFENALLNLCINARDAMPRGGKLVIETAPRRLDAEYAATRDEVVPGKYVEIAVTDTGTGMAPEILEHIFEPFFTMKEQGKGTGLGLSTVFGFMKQSGGHVAVYSEEGEGTTFKLYVPQANAMDDVPTLVETARPPRVDRGDRTILVVEDSSTVRDIAVDVLTAAGYRVVAAEDGHQGLARFTESEKVDLVFTDIVMRGGMSGPEMVERIRGICPAVQVLFTSGYAEQALKEKAIETSSSGLLVKPYGTEELIQRIDAALDEAGAEPRSR